jgi:hypothetical protein
MVASLRNGTKTSQKCENWKPTSKTLVLAELLVKEMRKMVAKIGPLISKSLRHTQGIKAG